MSVVRVLERLGIDVEVPLEQTCCGQPAYNAGFQADARTVARHTISVRQRREGPIVIASGSCADMGVHQYEGLFHGYEEWLGSAPGVAERCPGVSRFRAGMQVL